MGKATAKKNRFVNVSKEEMAQLQYHLMIFRHTSTEIQKLTQQRDQAARDANTTWKSVYRGEQLNDPELAKVKIPDFIDQNGQFGINIEDGKATWKDGKPPSTGKPRRTSGSKKPKRPLPEKTSESEKSSSEDTSESEKSETE